MDIGLNTLLVALMFVTILCMGIGNILMVLASVFNHATSCRRDRVHIGWMFLVLLIHFNLFWHTKEILNVENWRFGGFLLAVAGPIMLFFATSVLLSDPPDEEEPDLGEFFIALGRRFFVMFAAVQIWIVGIDLVLTGSFVATDMVNVLLVLLAVALAMNSSARAQVVGVWTAWGLGLASFVVRWLAQSG